MIHNGALYMSFSVLKANVLSESRIPAYKGKLVVGSYYDGSVDSFVADAFSNYDQAVQRTKKLSPQLWVMACNGHIIEESQITPDTLDSWTQSVASEYQKQLDSAWDMIREMDKAARERTDDPR